MYVQLHHQAWKSILIEERGKEGLRKQKIESIDFTLKKRKLSKEKRIKDRNFRELNIYKYTDKKCAFILVILQCYC